MSSGGGGGKKHIEEEHENHERWLVSYADMMTLLMVLFIVLFALGTVDAKKFEALATGLSTGFGGPMSVVTANTGILDQPGTLPAPVQLAPQDLPPAAETAAATTPQTPQVTASAEPGIGDGTLTPEQEAALEAQNLREIKAQINAALAAAGLTNAVSFRVDEDGLVVQVVTDSVIFQADRAELTAQGQAVLNAVAPELASLSNELEVSGHTNQSAARPKFYASEWELSAARATTVVRYLVEHDGLPKERLFAAAYGDTRPVYQPADDATGRRVNKRVDIVILTQASSEAKELLPGAAADVTDPIVPATDGAAHH